MTRTPYSRKLYPTKMLKHFRCYKLVSVQRSTNSHRFHTLCVRVKQPETERKTKMFKLVFVLLFILSTDLHIVKSTSIHDFDFDFGESLTNYQMVLLDHIERIFCAIRTIFINISMEENVSNEFSIHILRKLGACSASGIMINR